MATVHGVIYEWGTFEPLENVIVEVNSTPSQSMLARYGLYSFNLAPGNYVISASYYRNNVFVYSAQEEITIKGSGDYVMDIIFLPTFYDSGLDETEFTELNELADLAQETDMGRSSFSYGTLSMIILTALAFVAGAHLLTTRHKVNLAREEEFLPADETLFSVSDEHNALPDDLQEVVYVISRHGGRITQKDLRGALKHSEAKVSLMVSDLENRGIVQKFKKGRGNVIILAVPEGSEPEMAEAEGPNQNI
ncbi:hypothetical protein Mpsy_0820 [Methanolobus psychrophilus R15]|nr:hypothetical protein Mpsy_0820 [Methanolobus psychrophilus R15]